MCDFAYSHTRTLVQSGLADVRREGLGWIWSSSLTQRLRSGLCSGHSSSFHKNPGNHGSHFVHKALSCYNRFGPLCSNEGKSYAMSYKVIEYSWVYSTVWARPTCECDGHISKRKKTTHMVYMFRLPNTRGNECVSHISMLHISTLKTDALR